MLRGKSGSGLDFRRPIVEVKQDERNGVNRPDIGRVEPIDPVPLNPGRDEETR
jgi:hypothetical protein